MFQYKIIYSARRSIGINVSPDNGVTVRAPFGTNRKTIERIVESKSGWIRKHLDKHSAITRLNGNSTFNDGSTILFRNNEYKLRIREATRNSVIIEDGTVCISTTYPENKEVIKIILRKWYEVKATELFGSKLNDLLTRYESYRFSPTGFVVRTMKRRWGSCSSKGRITLNAELIKLDDKYGEYVLLHELCHLHHPNHGKEFYRLLGEVFPEWKSVRKELRNYIG